MTTKLEPLGIRRARGAALLRPRPRAEPPLLHAERMDFAETARRAAPRSTRDGHQRSALFEAGDVRIVCSAAARRGRARLALPPQAPRRRRDGDLRGGGHRAGLPAPRGARRHAHHRRAGAPRTRAGTLAHLRHHHAVRRHHLPLRRAARLPRALPGHRRATRRRWAARTAFGFGHIDHLTSNFQTMKPALLWMEHVLGLEEFWEVQFHTPDAAEAKRAALEAQHGSGLRSVVMRDPRSGVKFANNEPWRPAFKSSQINVFDEDHRGDGIQHAALTVTDILAAVRGLRARGVEFMPTPAALLRRAARSGSRRTGIGADRRGRRRRSASSSILVDGAGARLVPAADLPARLGRPLPRAGGRPVLLRDHPAQGRRGVRRRATSARSSSRSSASSSARGAA